MKLSVIGLAVACLLVAGSAFASTGKELAKAKCGACHSGVMARPLADIVTALMGAEGATSDGVKEKIKEVIANGTEVEGKKMMPMKLGDGEDQAIADSLVP